MASQALYRRYRSQTFDELVGQEHIVQTLRNAVAEGRIAHAYLFTGPRGVGKTSVARLLAKGVNCTAAAAQRPCGVCESCVAIAEGRAVDVIEMDAASHTSVDDAREIIERVQFRPTNGAYKVYIIDEVHMLSTAAFNALLKTLEEPPGHALFILATTEIHKVPATILSRCQKFTFNRHTVSAIAAHLQSVAAQEHCTLEPGVAEALARAATGSMRDALSLLDQLMAYGSGGITLEQVRNVLGATAAQEVGALVEALIDRDMATALRAVASVSDQGADLRQFARDVVEWLRGLMLLKAGGDPSLLDVSEDQHEELARQAQAGELQAFLQWVKLFSSLDFQIRTSAIPQLPLEMAVVEALTAPVQPAALAQAAPRVAPARTAPQRPAAAPAAPPAVDAAMQAPPDTPTPARQEPPPAPPADEPRAPARTARAAGGSAPGNAAAPATDGPAEGIASANAAAAALEQIEGIWPDVVRDVRVYNKMLQALLNSGVRPVDVQDNVIVLEVANEFLLGRLDKPELRQIVEQVVSKLTGGKYLIRCVVEAQRRENPNLLREQVRNSRKDPLVKAAMNIFDADIIAIEHDAE